MAFIAGHGWTRQFESCGNAMVSGRRMAPVTSPSTVWKKERRAVVMMGKGKGSKWRNAPLRQRQQVGPEIPEDGTPVFTVMVRSKTGSRMWYPCGGVQGDSRAKGLVDGTKATWGRALFNSALDRGIAKTVFESQEKWEDNVVRQIPALKPHRGNLEFGYKISAAGMETTPTRILDPDMTLPLWKWLTQKLFQRDEDDE